MFVASSTVTQLLFFSNRDSTVNNGFSFHGSEDHSGRHRLRYSRVGRQKEVGSRTFICNGES